MGQRLASLAILLALLACPLRSHGCSPIPCDGFACLYVVLVQGDTVVCTERLSGDTNRHLVAFDTAAGKVAWRRKTANWVFNVQPGATGEFYFTEDKWLHRCRLSDGITTDAFDLGSLAWPSNAGPTVFPTSSRIERIQEMIADTNQPASTRVSLQQMLRRFETAGGMTTNDAYFGLVVTPTTICIWRRRAWSDCESDRMVIQQWAAFDRNTRKTTASGEGQDLIGRVGKDGLLLADGQDTRLMLIEKGEARTIGEKFLEARRPWQVYATYPDRTRIEARSSGDSCLFNFGRATGGIWSNASLCAVYHAGNGTFSTIEPAWKPAEQADWLLQGSNVIQYRVSSGTNAECLALESYNLQGTWLARRELIGPAERCVLSFAGRTSHGDAIFRSAQYFGAGMYGDGQTVTGSVMVVEVPSLAVKAAYNLTDGVPPQSAFSCDAWEARDQIIQVLGNGEIWSMEKESQLHRFVVRGVDAYTGRELWRISEDATVRKRVDR